MTSSVLVKLWSKFSVKLEIVQNDEKMTVFKGFKPQKRSVFGRSDRTRTCSILVPNKNYSLFCLVNALFDPIFTVFGAISFRYFR